MAHPLEPAYSWRTPVVVSGVGLVISIGLLARGQAVGWGSVAALLVALWGVFLLVAYRRSRAYLLVDGYHLRIRPFRRFVDIDGRQVLAVRQVPTPRGPSFRLTVRTAEGTTSRHLVPTAWLRGGQSTFFTWLSAHAPQAELDKGSRRTLDLLQERGLV